MKKLDKGRYICNKSLVDTPLNRKERRALKSKKDLVGISFSKSSEITTTMAYRDIKNNKNNKL